MSAELHQRIRKLFDDALDLPESERLLFLRTACGDDAETYRAVTRLLDVYRPSQSFLEDPAPGMERIGRYLITGELGRGAMGVVYEAVDPLIRRSVAVKVIHLQSLADRSEAEFLRDRLFREARSAGQLLHPGIVVIFDVGQEGDLAFIAMERVNGPSLHHALASGKRFSHGEILDILRQTASALDHAHQRGVVHCDVKPGNIILDKGGAVKLTDFGIAKITSTQYHTRAGLLMGTPSFMSPEQIDGATLDGRSDQFSLAVVAFQLLTGSLPFRSDSIAGMAHAIVYSERPSAGELNPDLPADVDEVLARGLEKLAGDRFPGCMQFVSALEKALAAVPVSPQAAAPVLAAPAQHRAAAVRWYIAAAVVVLLASVLGYRSLVQVPSRSQPRPPTRTQPVQPSLAAPDIAEFVSDPPSVRNGAAATLRWGVEGAVKVVIDPDIGSVEARGSTEVKPKLTAEYSLTATGPGGQIATRTVRVVVESPPGAQAILARATAEYRAKHIQLAISLFRQAADLGETNAMVELSNLYDDGKDGVTQDYAEAMHWAQMAADRGSSPGMLLLGSMYYLPHGVPQDYARAAYWFRKAADGGDPNGKYDLGTMYEAGLGVPIDLAKADQLYREAARLGNEEAAERLVKLSRGH